MRAILDRRPLVVTAVLVLLIKLALFALDPMPLFFWGDSGSYIGSAINGYVLADQASGYGVLVRWFAVWRGMLTTLVLAQVVAGAVVAWLAAWMLIRYLGVRPPIAIGIAIACAVEPLQVIHERLVLAEAFTQLVFAGFLGLILWYIRRQRLVKLVAICGVGLVLVSLRLVYVALALSIPLLPAALTVVRRWFPDQINLPRWPGQHLAVAIIMTLGLHLGYRQLIGTLAHTSPTYLPLDGYALLAAWAPLIRPDDAGDPRARQVIEGLLAAQPPTLNNRFQREYHRWLPGGLIDRLHTAFGGDDEAANRAARDMVASILWRNPLAVVQLTVGTYLDHWRLLSQLDHRLRVEQGSDNPLPESFIRLARERFGIDATLSLTTMTLSKRYHLAGRPWYILLLVAPGIILMSVFLARSSARLDLLMLLGISCLLLAPTYAGAHLPHWRYLYPLTFPTLLAVGVIIDWLLSFSMPAVFQKHLTPWLSTNR